MPIKNISVKNFKSIQNIDVTLKDINLLIGANGSGKSNFIEIFRFLGQIIDYGIDNAISMQGGIEYLRNCNIGPSENLEISIILDLINEQPTFDIGRKIEHYKINIIKLQYTLTLDFTKKSQNSNFLIIESMEIEYTTSKINKKQSTFGESPDLLNPTKIISDSLGEGKLKFSKNPEFTTELNYPSKLEENKREDFKKNLLNSLLYEDSEESKKESNVSLLNPIVSIPHFPLALILDEIVKPYFKVDIFDFDPRLAKKASLFTGKLKLEEDGSNLPIILKNIIKNDKQKSKFNKKLSYVLPFIKELGVEDILDKSTILKLNEKSFNNSLPAFLISDGTIHVVCLIIALFYNNLFDSRYNTKGLIIEEPERNLHPALILKISDLIQKASSKKQIIITTHNPEFLRNFPIENILLVYRNEKEFSSIINPQNSERIKKFLQDDIGVDQLYIESLLEP